MADFIIIADTALTPGVCCYSGPDAGAAEKEFARQSANSDNLEVRFYWKPLVQKRRKPAWELADSLRGKAPPPPPPPKKESFKPKKTATILT